MKTTITAVAFLLSAAATAAAGTYRIDTVQSVLPVNYPVYATVAQAPVVVQSPVLAPAPYVVQSPVIVPAPVVAAPVVTYYAPAPVYYAPVRARTIIRPWGARTVYRYW